MPYRVLVTGDRNWECHALAHRITLRLAYRHADLVIVHGAATGVDIAFHAAAIEVGAGVEPHPAEWDNLDLPGALIRRRDDGTSYVANAGPLRNQEMVDAGAAICLACHANLKWSKGTKDCARRAMEAGIPVWLIESDAEDARPVRITEEDL